jgi:hypothetical protein
MISKVPSTLLIILSLAVIAISAPFTVSFNTRFLIADRFTVDTSQSFNNASYPNWNALTYLLSYSDAFPNAVNTSVAIATDRM